MFHPSGSGSGALLGDAPWGFSSTTVGPVDPPSSGGWSPPDVSLMALSYQIFSSAPTWTTYFEVAGAGGNPGRLIGKLEGKAVGSAVGNADGNGNGRNVGMAGGALAPASARGAGFGFVAGFGVAVAAG